MKWIIRFFSAFHIPFNVKKITGLDYYEIASKIKLGDAIFGTTQGWFLNPLNPSEFKHGAIYIGGDDIKYVLEATDAGVIRTDLVTFCLRRDKLCVKTVKQLSDMQRKAVVAAALQCEGAKYDWTFTPSNSKYYCFELIAHAYKVGVKQLIIKPHKIFGTIRYLSQSFNSWETVWSKNG